MESLRTKNKYINKIDGRCWIIWDFDMEFVDNTCVDNTGQCGFWLQDKGNLIIHTLAHLSCYSATLFGSKDSGNLFKDTSLHMTQPRSFSDITNRLRLNFIYP